MALVFAKVEPGDVLYDVHSHRMGNTTMRAMGTWTVHVFEVDRESGRAFVSWNGNRKEWWSARRIARLRRSPGKDWGGRMFITRFELPAKDEVQP